MTLSQKKGNSLVKKIIEIYVTFFAITSTSSCFSENMQNKFKKTEENKSTTQLNIIKTDNFIKDNSVKEMTEWNAFSIYHPTSNLTDDNFSKSHLLKQREHELDKKVEDKNSPHHFKQILGARSLIPILRYAFGNQARSSSEDEQDSWFTTHPSSLFTPEQMKAFCDYDTNHNLNEFNDVCWKPRLSEHYLFALSEFAADACPQLVEREFKSNNLFANKLVKSRDFRESNIKAFAQNWLSIPPEKITSHWLEKINKDAVHALKEHFSDATVNEKSDLSPYSAELYTLACQAILLSTEFYTR